MAEIKKLSKETLNKCFWTWEWTYQACYNYENMQGGCFLDAMAPAIRELYPAAAFSASSSPWRSRSLPVTMSPRTPSAPSRPASWARSPA